MLVPIIAAIFTLLNAAFLDPLPFRDAVPRVVDDDCVFGLRAFEFSEFGRRARRCARTRHGVGDAFALLPAGLLVHRGIRRALCRLLAIPSTCTTVSSAPRIRHSAGGDTPGRLAATVTKARTASASRRRCAKSLITLHVE